MHKNYDIMNDNQINKRHENNQFLFYYHFYFAFVYFDKIACQKYYVLAVKLSKNNFSNVNKGKLWMIFTSYKGSY